MAKIALVTTSEGTRSGVTVFMEALCKELNAVGHDAELVRPVKTELTKVSVPGDLMAYALLRDRLKEFDLVIGNGIGLVGAVDLPVKVIDNIHSTAEGAAAALRAAYESITPTEKECVDTVLGALLGVGFESVEAAIVPKPGNLEIDRIVARRADSVIAVSPRTAQDAIEYFGAEAGKVTTVMNGIDEFWFDSTEVDPRIAANPVNVVFTGRGGVGIRDIFLKGVDRIMGTADRIRDIPFTALMLVHGDEKTAIYADLCPKMGVDGIFNLPNERLRPFLRFGDIHLHTSRSEACNLSQLEAMAAGLVPVTFEAGIVPDLIEDGVNGFKVRTIEEMVDRIRSLVGDDEMRKRMAAAAQATVRGRHAERAMLDAYVQLIAEALEK